MADAIDVLCPVTGWPYPLESSVCITGHRRKHLKPEWYEDIKYQMRRMVQKSLLPKEGTDSIYCHFLTGMALETDTWFAEIITEMEDCFAIAAVPFVDQADIWPEEQREHYYDLLQKMDDVYYVDQEPLDEDEPRFPFDETGVPPKRTKDYDFYVTMMLNRRNRWMVRRVSMVWAIWTGAKGGTKNTIDFALKQGKTVIVYNPANRIFQNLSGVV